MILRTVLLLSLALLPGWAWGARPASDAARLHQGLEKGFRRPKVLIYPLLDQRLLAEAEVSANGGPTDPPAWTAFVEGLKGAANLRVRAPGETRKAIQSDERYRGDLENAKNFADRGFREHRAVRLEIAAADLHNALRQFKQIEQQYIEPRRVARTSLTRGLALLESGNAVQAGDAFREALLLDPSLRLRPGYDHPAAVEAFEQARRSLSDEPPEPPWFIDTPAWAVGEDYHIIRGRVVDDRLELVIISAGVIRKESQPLGPDPASDGSRLASRVWACLPFGRAPTAPAFQPKLHLDAGFSYFVFLESPVELFSNVGVGVNASWLVAPYITLDLNAGLTNSNRDREEDLRRDIPIFRGSLGAGYALSGDRFRLTANLGVEVATIGEVVTTSEPGCKYFPAGTAPPAICDPNLDIDRYDTSIFLGPVLSIGTTLRLVDEIYLALRVHAATYIFESMERSNGLGVPVGAQLGLGYQLL